MELAISPKRLPAGLLSVQRREYLKAVGGVASVAAVAGCTDMVGGSTGTLATSVSDQPHDIGDFERLVVTIHEIRVQRRDGDDTGNETTTGNETDDGDRGAPGDEQVIEVDDAEADLVELQGDNTQLIDETELETGTYNYLKLGVRDEVDAELEDGGEADVQTPGDAPLMFNQSFEVRDGQRTHFVADFAPVRRGDGTYLLRPVPDEIRVEYEDEPDADDGEDSDADGNESDA